MSLSLISTYETELAALLTAIEGRLQRLSTLSGEPLKDADRSIVRDFEGANEYVDLLELEVRQLPKADASTNRLKHFKSEVNRLRRQFQSGVLRRELFSSSGASDDANSTANQRQRLLEANERLEQSTRKLQESVQTVEELNTTVAPNILLSLHEQREKLEHSRRQLDKVDDNLAESDSILKRMYRRSIMFF